MGIIAKVQELFSHQHSPQRAVLSAHDSENCLVIGFVCTSWRSAALRQQPLTTFHFFFIATIGLPLHKELLLKPG